MDVLIVPLYHFFSLLKYDIGISGGHIKIHHLNDQLPHSLRIEIF